MLPTFNQTITSILPGNIDSPGPTQNSNAAMIDSATDGITAQHTSPSQSTAILLTSKINRVTTVTTANDAVRLPPSIVGLSITVSNAAVNNLGVYPSSATQGGVTGGDAINALAQNAVFAQATGVTVYRCYTLGTWQTA
jgi:hypothetical protein